MSQDLSNPRIKLPHIVIVKAPGLLPMLYTVRGLAAEISMPERTLRDWLIHGAPHTRDRLGDIWVNGQAFAAWVAAQRKKTCVATLKPGEGYCMVCNRIVMVLHPIRRPSAGKLVYNKVFARPVTEKSLGERGVIHRSNYLLVRRYIQDLEEIYQLSGSSLGRYRFYLRHLLLWAGETPFPLQGFEHQRCQH